MKGTGAYELLLHQEYYKRVNGVKILFCLKVITTTRPFISELKSIMAATTTQLQK